jgi:DNA-binding Lrp family transcriptional regulator
VFPRLTAKEPWEQSVGVDGTPWQVSGRFARTGWPLHMKRQNPSVLDILRQARPSNSELIRRSGLSAEEFEARGRAAASANALLDLAARGNPRSYILAHRFEDWAIVSARARAQLEEAIAKETHELRREDLAAMLVGLTYVDEAFALDRAKPPQKKVQRGKGSPKTEDGAGKPQAVPEELCNACRLRITLRYVQPEDSRLKGGPVWMEFPSGYITSRRRDIVHAAWEYAARSGEKRADFIKRAAKKLELSEMTVRRYVDYVPPTPTTPS